MASWQDIRELEEKIYCVVEDYLKYPEGYIKPVLRVYLEEVEYKAEFGKRISTC